MYWNHAGKYKSEHEKIAGAGLCQTSGGRQERLLGDFEMRQNERKLWGNLSVGAKIHCFGQQKVLQSIARDAMAV